MVGYKQSQAKVLTHLQVGDEITFSNGVAEVTSYAADNSLVHQLVTMTVELKTIDANNPINDTMSFTSDTSIGVVRSVVSTTLSEPNMLTSRTTYFRYQLNRPSGTSGWEKLVRDGFRYYDPMEHRLL